MSRVVEKCLLPKMSDIEFRQGLLDHAQVVELLQQHLRDMYATSPVESVHALDLEELRDPQLSFWTLWKGEALAACGALKSIDKQHAEIKSMRTGQHFLRQGIADQLLGHLLAQARLRGFQRVSLETGTQGYFEPARQLYLKHGFAYCQPFAEYREDPNSVFMSVQLV